MGYFVRVWRRRWWTRLGGVRGRTRRANGAARPHECPRWLLERLPRPLMKSWWAPVAQSNKAGEATTFGDGKISFRFDGARTDADAPNQGSPSTAGENSPHGGGMGR